MIKVYTAFRCHDSVEWAINEMDGMEVWYGAENQPNYVRLIDVPNTLGYLVTRR